MGKASEAVRGTDVEAFVVTVREGSDGSEVVIATVADGGLVAQHLAAVGLAVSVEDSENPDFVSLRVR